MHLNHAFSSNKDNFFQLVMDPIHYKLESYIAPFSKQVIKLLPVPNNQKRLKLLKGRILLQNFQLLLLHIIIYLSTIRTANENAIWKLCYLY